MRIHVHVVDKKAKSVMEAAAGPSRALMEISQLLTQTADDFHKMAKKTKLSDSGSTSATATTTESDDTGRLVFVGTYLCDKQYLIGVFSVPFSYFPVYLMCRSYFSKSKPHPKVS